MSHAIPHYALYGDQVPAPGQDSVHIEQIHERSSMFEYDIAPHVHQHWIQVLYLTVGGGEAVIDGVRWPLHAPCLIIIPSQHVHAFRFERTVDGPVVTAAQRPLESLAAVGTPDLMPHIRRPAVLDVGSSPRQAQALQPLFDAIARESQLQPPRGTSAGTALLLAIFVHIARIAQNLAAEAAPGPSRSRKAELVERFRSKVDAHFRERWSVEAYAATLGMSAGQLSRLCRDLLGVSALDVVNARIVHEAERELVYSTWSVKQIASLLGFADEAYFGRFFKKHTGASPSNFRADALKRLAP